MKTAYLYLLLLSSISNAFQIGSTPPAKLKGRVCAYGDMDRDLYTDLILLDAQQLRIHFQTEEGGFRDSPVIIDIREKSMVTCAVGDFNGDAIPDILVTSRRSVGEGKEIPGHQATVFINMGGKYTPFSLNESFADELAIADVNGDGTSDLLGFLAPGGEFYCRLGNSKNGSLLPCENYFSDELSPKFLKGFPISFVDVDGDLSSEIIFGEEMVSVASKVLILNVWSRGGSNQIWLRKNVVKNLELDSSKYYGSPLFSDFDADGMMDIAVPVCSDRYCRVVENFKMWNGNCWLSVPLYGLVGSNLVSSNEPVSVVFRVGDFTLDGYPDMIALVNETRLSPMILENTECSDCTSNATRAFFLRTSPRLIQPSEVSLGTIQMVSFFDLKEDGNLDVLLEYVSADDKKNPANPTSVDFIRSTDAGDTTFLKVEVFSSSCIQDCGSDKIKIGSGIAWHGACVSYNMSVSRKLEQRGVQCQMPQTTHRTFYSPFALFGLGRSPNFVDYVRIGSPRLPLKVHSVNYGNQRYSLKQIVPNSRVIVVPPKDDGTHWQSRLYVTPSALIIQSLLVLVSVCSILLVIIAVLHIRERRIDKQERQAQSHRFHFDAM